MLILCTFYSYPPFCKRIILELGNTKWPFIFMLVVDILRLPKIWNIVCNLPNPGISTSLAQAKCVKNAFCYNIRGKGSIRQ